MKNDLDNTIREAEEAIESLEKLANDKLHEAEQKIKKGVVQGTLWLFVTIAIYFIWGTTWFFWVSVASNVITFGALIFAKVMIAKVKNRKDDPEDYDDEYDFDADIVDEDEEEIEYDEKQKVLESLLNKLGHIAEEHGEIYDTDCREQMSEAVFNAFIFEKENYEMPNEYGLYEKAGNEAVKKVLSEYVNKMIILAKENSPKERLDMFQDDVYNEDDESPDEFFGWMDSEDLVSA